MSEWSRLMLGFAAAFVYTCLICMKAVDLSKLKTEGSNESYVPDNRNQRKRKTLMFDLIRLAVDGALLIGFLVSDLCPAWFSLFHATALGYCTGCFELISSTLLISVFVDWFPYCKRSQSVGRKVPFSRFFLKQTVNIVRIEFALALVWIVFLILEPTKTNLLLKLAAAALVLLLLRGVLRLARGPRNKPGQETKTE